MRKFLENYNLTTLKPSLLKILISFIWMTFFLYLGDLETDFSDIYNWMSLPGLLYFVLSILSLIVYAWIINPIKEFRKRKGK